MSRSLVGVTHLRPQFRLRLNKKLIASGVLWRFKQTPLVLQPVRDAEARAMKSFRSTVSVVILLLSPATSFAPTSLVRGWIRTTSQRNENVGVYSYPSTSLRQAPEARQLERIDFNATGALGKDNTAEIVSPSPTIPSVPQIVRFCIPAMAIWLCSPLLSMMDTSTVGLFAGTVQQAALNPAVAVTDYSARTMVSSISALFLFRIVVLRLTGAS